MDPTKTVIDLISAIVDGRTEDALVLVDPSILWEPIARPGLSLYQGHTGIIRLINDLHIVYGKFRVEIIEVVMLRENQVMVRAQAIRETDEGDVFIPVSESLFTLRNGLVNAMQAKAVKA
jgi:hypothetical protein